MRRHQQFGQDTRTAPTRDVLKVQFFGIFLALNPHNNQIFTVPKTPGGLMP
jgi:hypothetical protein